MTVAKGRGVLRDGDDGVRTLDLSVTGRMPCPARRSDGIAGSLEDSRVFIPMLKSGAETWRPESRRPVPAYTVVARDRLSRLGDEYILVVDDLIPENQI